MDLSIRIKGTVDFIMYTGILQFPSSKPLILLQMISLTNSESVIL